MSEIDKPPAFFDLDGTLHRGMSYFALFREQVNEGLATRSKFLEARIINFKIAAHAISYTSGVSKLLDTQAAALEGKSYDAVAAHAKSFYQRHAIFFPCAKPIVEALSHSHRPGLVTAAAGFAGNAAGEIFDMDFVLSSTYELDDKGNFTGKVAKKLASSEKKAKAVEELGMDLSQAWAFGDSEIDWGMLQLVKHPVLVDTRDNLANIALQNSWLRVTRNEIDQANVPLNIQRAINNNGSVHTLTNFRQI